jgi:hypothetical protein
MDDSSRLGCVWQPVFRRRRCAVALDFVYVEHSDTVQGDWRGEVLDEESSKGRWQQTVRQGAERA